MTDYHFTDDRSPVVLDRNGHSITDNKSSLSLTDLESMVNIKAPVSTEDALDTQNLDDSIYLFNVTGTNLKVIGTTHRVDRTGEDQTDPDNYDLEINQEMQNGAVTKIPVRDVIWVATRIFRTGNQFPQLLPTIAIESPNGSVLSYRLAQGAVRPFVTRDEARAPNCLHIENRVTNSTDIEVWIYTENPECYPPSKFQKPAFQARIGYRNHDEYTHLINYRFWLANFFSVIPSNGAMDSLAQPYNHASRLTASKDYRTGTIEWYSMCKDVRPGDYVFLVTNPNERAAKFVFKIYPWESLKIIPKQQYMFGQP